MNMKYKFEKFSKNNVLLSVVMIVLGIALILWPGKTLELAANIVGIALLVGAAVSGYSWFKSRNSYGADYTTLAVGIVCLIAGLIVLIAPRGVITLLPKIIGVIVLLNGILNLAQALDMRNHRANWVAPLVLAVLTIIAGAFLIFFSFSAMKAAVMVIGGIIVYNGVSNLLIEKKYRGMGNEN